MKQRNSHNDWTKEWGLDILRHGIPHSKGNTELSYHYLVKKIIFLFYECHRGIPCRV
jgi:hypothetical protein